MERADASVEQDGGVADDGGPVVMIDGGPVLERLVLADDCNAGVPVITLDDAPSVMRAIDTRSLGNDYDTLGCITRPTPGTEGFFAVDMIAGERWHFHVRRKSAGADPILYVFQNMCSDLACDREAGLDACRQDSDEHLSLLATQTGRYYVGIDSGVEGGFEGSIEVFRPVCGDGVQTHGESCEPGINPMITCMAAECRVALSPGGSVKEEEVNDDSFMANQLMIAGGQSIRLSGRTAALCENDMFGIDVAEGESIRASLRTAGNAACPVAETTPVYDLQVLGADGVVVLAHGENHTGGCPSIEEGDAAGEPLSAGRYYVRVYALNPAARPFDYTLNVSVVAAP